MELGGDTKAVLLAAGLIFLGALLLGVWKCRQMAASPDGLATRTSTSPTAPRSSTRSRPS